MTVETGNIHKKLLKFKISQLFKKQTAWNVWTLYTLIQVKTENKYKYSQSELTRKRRDVSLQDHDLII